MIELRCSECGRFLCKLIFGEVEIKCTRCKTINHFRLDTYKGLLTVKPAEASIKS